MAQDVWVVSFRVVCRVCRVKDVRRPGATFGIAFEDKCLIQTLRVRGGVLRDNIDSVIGIDNRVIVQDVVVVGVVFKVLPVLDGDGCVDIVGVV
jgi:hypothetical protein